jgi:hypothetical protein
MTSANQIKGFSGIIDRVRLMDLVQVLSIVEKSADLEIYSALGSGLMNIRSGQICHCETGPICGEEALLEILSWPGGSFEFKPEDNEIPQSIKKTWEQLLIESILHLLEENPDSTDAKNSFSGQIEGMDLLELVELACLSKADRVLRVKAEGHRGAVFFNERGICHVEYGTSRDESAFSKMALAETGTFESVRPEGDEPVTIERPWDDLLVEAKRHRDENRTGAHGGDIASFLQQVQRMKVAQKVRLALVGNKETRMILARDGNKIVQLAVMNNPKLSDFEVTLIGSSKSTDEEVFRKIAASREWMRLRQIRAALVNNPKCPIPIAGKLIETLGIQDWKRIAASRSIASIIRASAKRLMSKKL